MPEGLNKSENNQEKRNEIAQFIEGLMVKKDIIENNSGNYNFFLKTKKGEFMQGSHTYSYEDSAEIVDHSHPAGPIEEEFNVATKPNKTDDSKAFYEKTDDVDTFVTLIKFNSKNVPSHSIEEVKAQLREMNIIE